MQQFACAWTADGKQVLAYLWNMNNLCYVTHKTMDSDHNRETFSLSFETFEDGWRYFDAIRLAKDDVRSKIENTLEKLFEVSAKAEEDSEDDESDFDDIPL